MLFVFIIIESLNEIIYSAQYIQIVPSMLEIIDILVLITIILNPVTQRYCHHRSSSLHPNTKFWELSFPWCSVQVPFLLPNSQLTIGKFVIKNK